MLVKSHFHSSISWACTSKLMICLGRCRFGFSRTATQMRGKGRPAKDRPLRQHSKQRDLDRDHSVLRHEKRGSNRRSVNPRILHPQCPRRAEIIPSSFLKIVEVGKGVSPELLPLPSAQGRFHHHRHVYIKPLSTSLLRGEVSIHVFKCFHMFITVITAVHDMSFFF